MKKSVIAFVICALSLAFAFGAFADEAKVIKLPEPEKSGGIGVLDAIAARCSATDFVDTEISEQDLSTLLWVAAGINRPDSHKITFATAMNLQDMIIYAFTKSGTYKYNPENHSLELIAEGDKRVLTGSQPFVAKAAVDLLYIQDAAKWDGLNFKAPAENILQCGFAHAGLSMQGVYLYAASKNWGARTRMNFDREGLTKLLNLTDKHNFTLMICVGEVK